VITVIVLATILGLLVAGFLAFYVYSRTPEWGESDLRRSVLHMLVVIGPMLGMRYHEPHHEVPVISTPGPQHELLPGRDEPAHDDEAG
jgi:hypothetical protein